MTSRLEDAHDAYEVAVEAHAAVERAMKAADRALELAKDVLTRAENLAERQAAERADVREAFNELRGLTDDQTN